MSRTTLNIYNILPRALPNKNSSRKTSKTILNTSNILLRTLPDKNSLRKMSYPLLSFLFIASTMLQLTGCAPVLTWPGAEGKEFIPADNPKIEYIGRFDFSNPKDVVFDWAGVYIVARFQGTSCSVLLKDSTDEYDVVVDDHAPVILQADSTREVYVVAAGLSPLVPHTVMIQKRTEALVGVGHFMGFLLDRGCRLLAPPKRPDRRIEFIGNSITSGYGIEADTLARHFHPSTENSALSFASITGRELHADYSLISYSGRGVVRNYGDVNKVSRYPMPALYYRTCCYDSTRHWNFKSWVPQVVVINLGTNDFSTHPFPDSAVFVEGYIRLIDRVRSYYPGVTIFCCSGPMIGEPCLGYVREVVKLEQEKERRTKDVFFVDMEGLLSGSDLGLALHPNVEGAWKMAQVLIREIKLHMLW